MRAPGVTRIWLAGVLALLALSAWVRLTQLPQVFLGPEVLPVAEDAHYHLHRIERSVETFPHVPVRDRFLNWPDGGPCPWAPGFDFMGAALVKLSGTAEDPSRRARVASMLPLLLGLLLVWVVMEIARRLVSDSMSGLAVGFATGVVLALTPQSVAIARVARVDHHVAEALSMALLAGWALWAIRSRRTGPASRAQRMRFELAGWACAAWAGAVFSGAVLYVAVAGLLLIGANLLSPDRGETWGERIAGSGGPALVAAAGLLAWLNRGPIAEHGQLLSYQFPSLLQPVLYLIAGVAVFASQLVLPVAKKLVSPALRALVRAAVLSGGFLLVLGATQLGAPSILSQVWAGCTEWLAGSDPWLRTISEFQPLDRNLIYEQFGVFGVLAPLVLPLGVWRVWRDDPARAAFFAAWTLLLLPLALMQSRFGRIFVVNLSIAWGLAAFGIIELARTRWGTRKPEMALTALAACALLLLGMADPASRKRLIVAEPRDPSAIETAGLFLRDVPRDDTLGAEGVLTDWEFGHSIIWISKRPVVAAGFGPYTGATGFQEVLDFPQRSEAQLMELMERRRLGFLVTGSATFLRRVPSPEAASPFTRLANGAGGLNPAYFRSLPLAPLLLAGTGLPQLGVKHLEHLRPRFASPQLVENLAFPVPSLWVYERVRGAELRGHAPAAAPISARINLHAPGFRVPYTAWTSAAADGSYRLVIPLPSGLADEALKTDPHYTLRVGDGAPRSVSVPERAVLDGEVIQLDARGG